MRLLLGCLVVHEFLALSIPFSWAVPNVTLVGLVLAIWQRPARWAWYTCVAAVSVLPWAATAGVPLMVCYSAVGAGLAFLAVRLDLEDQRLQYAVAGVAAAALTFWMQAAKHLSSWPMLGWGLIQVGVTVLALAAVQHGRRLRER